MKKFLQWGCAVLVILTLISCAWVYRQLFPDCNTPPDDPNVEVIVSACRKPHLYSISPDGTYLVYGAGGRLWLRNLVIDEEQPLPIRGRLWLSDRWLLQEADIHGVRQFGIFDVTDGTQTPLQWVHKMPEMTSQLNDVTLVFSPEVLTRLKNAEAVYFAPEVSLNIVVALAPDFKAHPEANCVLTIPGSGHAGESKAIAVFLTENAIPYIKIQDKYHYHPPDPLPSHDGRFIATGTRITTTDGRVIVQTQELFGTVNGWAHDNSGVYFQLPRNDGGSIFMPLFRVGKAQPILKLKVPEVHRQSTATPSP